MLSYLGQAAQTPLSPGTLGTIRILSLGGFHLSEKIAIMETSYCIILFQLHGTVKSSISGKHGLCAQSRRNLNVQFILQSYYPRRDVFLLSQNPWNNPSHPSSQCQALCSYQLLDDQCQGRQCPQLATQKKQDENDGKIRVSLLTSYSWGGYSLQ